MLTDFKGADFVFYALFVEVSHREVGGRIEFEMYFDVWHPRLQGFGFHTAIGIEKLMAKGEEGDSTIHGATVYVDVTDLLGKGFGHGAFSARTVAVDSYDDFRH